MDGLGPGGPGAFTLCLTPGQVGDDPPVGLPEGLAEALRGQVALAASGSDTGAVLLWDPPMLRLIVPPIPVPEPLLAPGLDPGPLRTLLASAPLIAVVLVRLGRFAVGLYRGEELVESKVGGRFVKGRHRAGGSSSNRFRRIREKQADELFKAVCRTVQDRLDPFQSEIRHLFLGGERTTLLGFRGRCPYMARFDGVLRRRVLDVREPGQQALRDLPRLLWESEVFEVREEP
jgi:hypothetical protein